MIRIVTDSTCDLPEALIEQYGITVVPLYIHIGEESYLDGVDLSRREFYERLPQETDYPKTAIPSVELYKQAYRRLFDAGADEILSIHISESLSGLIHVAQQASSQMGDRPVTVLDARQLSMGVGFAVLRAAEEAQAGRSLAELLALLEDQILRTYVMAVTDTFEYLHRSGRLGLLPYHLASLLKIRPMLKMYNGKSSVGAVRTLRRAIEQMRHLLQEQLPLERLAIVHALVPEQARQLQQALRPLLPPELEILWAEVNPTIGVHVGPGCFGLACVSAKSP
ncbi:MAG: DegV family protein [Chloroflexia bacterium]|nr:DegV family protein [Chloroflexia bacterium]